MRKLSFKVDGRAGESEALLERPDGAWAALVLAHGAGAGMHHEFMAALSAQLAQAGFAVLRYQFPYMQEGKKRPDPEMVLTSTVRAAIDLARPLGLPLFAGGKSMGGRMTSRAQAQLPDPDVRALVFFGFPLHMPKKPATTRADHLAQVKQPMLFLQGTRDALSDQALTRGVAAKLGEKATLCEIEGADHGFSVLKRSGRTDAEVMTELVERATVFCRAKL